MKMLYQMSSCLRKDSGVKVIGASNATIAMEVTNPRLSIQDMFETAQSNVTTWSGHITPGHKFERKLLCIFHCMKKSPFFVFQMPFIQ